MLDPKVFLPGGLWLWKGPKLEALVPAISSTGDTPLRLDWAMLMSTKVPQCSDRAEC